jgi:predicted PurR-regulated permease PerM
MTYLLMVAVVAIALGLLIPALIDQGQSFARQIPRTVERLSEFGTSVSGQLERRLRTRIDFGGWVGNRSDLIRQSLLSAGGFFRGAVQAMALVVIGMVVGFYLLVDLPRLRRTAQRLIPPDRREEVAQVAATVGRAMGGFFRGQLLVALIVGIMSSVGLRIIGLPYWLIVGMIAGLFNLVPLIGPFVGAVPAILIAATLRSPITILWVIVVMVVVQQIDNHFISPNVMRITVRLHPVTVMIGLIAGAALAGFWGMLLAVPVIASVKVIAAHYWRTRVPWGEEVFAEGDEMETMGPEQQAPPEAEVKAAQTGPSPPRD